MGSIEKLNEIESSIREIESTISQSLYDERQVTLDNENLNTIGDFCDKYSTLSKEFVKKNLDGFPTDINFENLIRSLTKGTDFKKILDLKEVFNGSLLKWLQG